jgi:hypothetical protein
MLRKESTTQQPAMNARAQPNAADTHRALAVIMVPFTKEEPEAEQSYVIIGLTELL